MLFDGEPKLPEKYRYQGYEALRQTRKRTRNQKKKKDQETWIEKAIIEFAEGAMREMLQKTLDELIGEINTKP